MPTVIVYFIAAFLGYSLSPGPQRLPEPAPVQKRAELAGFHITLDASTDRFALACKGGCSWKTLTLECRKDPCRFSVNDFGRVAAEAPAKPPLFGFTIEKKGSELVFVCERGCAWKTASVSCGTDNRCESRINEYGVAKLAK
jgi:hypothetical protein